jgi:alpha-1,3-mannosyltransferase
VRQFSPSVGGLEDCVLNLARIQREELGLSPKVVTLDRLFSAPDQRLARQDEVMGVPVTRIPWSGSSRYPIAPGVLRQIADADLVHVHGIDFFFDFLALTKPFHRKPLVATTHGGFFHTSFAAGLKRVYFQTVTRLSARAYGRIIACSEADAEAFGTIAPDTVTTIENGVDIAKFADAASPQLSRTLISFGRFTQHKRLDTLFPLLRELRRDGGDWRLKLAGVEADLTRTELLRLAAAEGVEGAVTVEVGLSDAELKARIGQASFFVSPSAYEGFGIAAVEALSAGLVPALSGIPPYRKLLSRVPDGVEIDPDAPVPAAEAIRQRHGVLSEGVTAARHRLMQAATPHDWRGVAKRYSAAYRFFDAARVSTA